MKVLAWLLGLLLVLGGAVVGGVYLFDDALRDRLERGVEANLTTSVPLTAPVVEIDGHPIAWHVVTGRFPEVRVRADAFPLPPAGAAGSAGPTTSTVALVAVEATLTDVVPTADAIRAAELTGGGLLTWSDVTRLAGTPITHAGDDRVAASGSLEVFGREVTGRLSAVPVLDEASQTITLGEPRVEVAGVRLPDQAVEALVGRLWTPFVLDLQYGLRVDAVRATPEGLRVGVRGTDVVLPTR